MIHFLVFICIKPTGKLLAVGRIIHIFRCLGTITVCHLLRRDHIVVKIIELHGVCIGFILRGHNHILLNDNITFQNLIPTGECFTLYCFSFRRR